MNEDHLGYEKRGRLAVIELRRPETLNALTTEMIVGIEDLMLDAEEDPEVFAICVTGQGRGFCAGLDMKVLAEHAAGRPPTAKSRRGRPGRPMLFGFLPEISKPIIAAVNGPAAGGGFVLAMMSDLRFMSEAGSLVTVFGKRGLIAEHQTAWMLPRMIGLSRAMDLLWSSRKVDAAEAWRIGLADRVVAPDRLLAEVEAYVEQMAATVSPRSVAIMKAQVHRDLALSFAEAGKATAKDIAEALVHPDATEGAAHFVERRSPHWAPWPPAAEG